MGIFIVSAFIVLLFVLFIAWERLDSDWSIAMPYSDVVWAKYASPQRYAAEVECVAHPTGK